MNVPLAIDGRRIVPDFRWPEQRLVVEADGAQWHDGELAREETQTLARFRAAGAPSG